MLPALVVASVLAAQTPAPPPPAPPPPAPAPAPAPAEKAPDKKGAEKSVKPSMHTPSKGTVTVAKVSAAKGGPTFEISVGDCKGAKGAPAECSVYVSSKGHREKLPWTTSAGAIYVQNDKRVDIGDDSDTALGLSWTPVTMAKGVSGVIVSQQTGGDRVKHRHDLFLDVKGAMTYALAAGPQRGENTWSTVTTLDVDGNGGDEIILVHASRPDADNEADTWDMSVWGWRADIGKVVKLPSWTPTIQAAMVGSFNNVKDARELASNKCLNEFVVVDSKSAPLLPDNTYAVVYPAATQRDADLALEAAKACDDEIVGAVKVISKGLDVKEKDALPE